MEPTDEKEVTIMKQWKRLLGLAGGDVKVQLQLSVIIEMVCSKSSVLPRGMYIVVL